MKAKIIGLILVVLPIFNFAFAGRMSVEKAEAFFKKNTPCVLAIAPIYPESGPRSQVSSLNQKLNQATTGEIMILSGHADSDVNIFCVFEGTKYKGTINEKQGCFAGYFNPLSGDWSGFLSENSGQTIGVMESKCTSDVVKDILNSTKITDSLKKTLVGQSIKARFGTFHTVFELYLRFSDFIVKPDLRVIYDQHNLINSLCPKSPCGPTILLSEQISAIKEDPADIEREKQFKIEEQNHKAVVAAQIKARDEKQKKLQKKADEDRKKKERLWD